VIPRSRCGTREWATRVRPPSAGRARPPGGPEHILPELRRARGPAGAAGAAGQCARRRHRQPPVPASSQRSHSRQAPTLGACPVRCLCRRFTAAVAAWRGAVLTCVKCCDRPAGRCTTTWRRGRTSCSWRTVRTRPCSRRSSSCPTAPQTQARARPAGGHALRIAQRPTLCYQALSVLLSKLM